MTDQTARDVTDDERRIAREWAEFIEADMSAWRDGVRAAARVILDAVPDPPRPTLADMTDEERAECRWMQADVENRRTRYVIANPFDDDGEVALIGSDGVTDWVFPEYVIPRPDLPRMTWPGTEKPAPALPGDWRFADHPDNGRVIVTTPTPDRNGHVYYALPAEYSMGFDWLFCDPDELTYIDTEPEADTSDAVPPNTLAVGSEWDDADALSRACAESGRDQIAVADKRGMVGVWDTGMQCWRVSAPHADFAPWTVRRIGWGDDQ